MNSIVHYKAPEIKTSLLCDRGKRFMAVKYSSAEQKECLGGEDPAWGQEVLVYFWLKPDLLCEAADLCLSRAAVVVRVLLA